MLVNIPWKGVYPLRDHQWSNLEIDERGYFLRIKNEATGRLNKCRVVSEEKREDIRKAPYILEGESVEGTIRKTGNKYVAIVVEKVGPFRKGHGLEEILFEAGVKHLKDEKRKWKVGHPSSWSMPIGEGDVLGPHVSLDYDVHKEDLGRRVVLTVLRIGSWEEESRWVALFLDGPFVGKHDWFLHLSVGQGRL